MSMGNVLTKSAESLARPSGFVQRNSKLTGPLFAKTLVLGWIGEPDASLSELCQVSAELGLAITPQGLEARLGPRAVSFLEQLLNVAVGQLITPDSVAIPILTRFGAVIIDDSTTIGLPDALAEVWSGTGERTGHNKSALKLQVRFDLCSGRLTGPLLQAGRANDRTSPLQTTPLPVGSLHLADLGYFSLDLLEAEQAAGSYWLRRLPVQTVVFDAKGCRSELHQLLAAQSQSQGSDMIDLEVSLGVEKRFRCRLLAARVPQDVAEERRRKLHAEARHKGQTVSQARLVLADWTIYVTNCPADLLTIPEALVLARLRWQIELLFKLWKSHGQLDTSRSANPARILIEIYAKLIGLLIQHWLLLLGCWSRPDRSLVKAASTVRQTVALLIAALRGHLPLCIAIELITTAIALGCRMNSRRTAPNAYQLLIPFKEVPLA
jgi:Transposase DDE domain